jgi:hypothetical protein
VKPGGHLVVELPDCTTSLANHDYAMIWEEHSLYFTPETFRQVPQLGGFETLREDVYPLPFENCIVHIARKAGAPRAFAPRPEAVAQQGLLADYAHHYEGTTRYLHDVLGAERAKGGHVALFGAGHFACAFVNVHRIGELVDFVADDTPQKRRLFLPGSRTPIVPSTALVERGITLCVLCLSIGSEERVITANKGFVEAGGRFRSALRASGRSIFNGV